MNIVVEKVTGRALMERAAKHVFGIDVHASLRRWYKSGHSPIRTQWFAIFVTDMRYSVAMQMRTHEKNGAVFIVEPGRPDTGSDRARETIAGNADYRDAKRNVFVLCNSQHLMDWSHKRLCNKAEDHTRLFMEALRVEIGKVDADLAGEMVPLCVYRNGLCDEFKPCGLYKKRKDGEK